MEKTKLHIDIGKNIKTKLNDLKIELGMKSTNELIRFILSDYLIKAGK